MRDIEFPLQSLVVKPVQMRLRFDLSWRADSDHALLRMDLREGSYDTQLGLYVGPVPSFNQPNEVRRQSVQALSAALHSINVAYFDGDTF